MGVTNRQTRAIESRFQKMNKNISASFADSLKGGVAGLGAALGVREIQQYADAWTEAGNKIRASATAAGVQARSLDSLKDGANDARVAFGDYVDLYARLIRSASGVAKSENEIAAATNAVAKAFKAGGASASEQAAGILQLGQALGSGVLQGDELRSLRENAPVVAQAIATEFKTTISGLKQLGAEGKLTSDRVFRAIINAIPGIEKQFASTNQTIGDGFMALRNNLTQYIGTTAETLGVTAAVNGVLQALAGNIGTVANAAAAAGVTLLATFGRGALLAGVAALANPFVALAAAIGAAAFAISSLWGEIVPLEGSFATLGDYASALWTILSDGATQTRETIVWAFEGIIHGISGALEGVGTSFEGVWDAVKTGVNAIIDTLVKMGETVGVAFTSLPAAIGDGVISTMNEMVAAVEAGINKVIGAVNTAIEAINLLGASIPTVPPVDLGEVSNQYASAGQKAADAFGAIWARETRDYVGDAGAAISGSVESATNAIVARANEVAEARRELERETNRANGLEKPNTAGYGKGGPAVDSGGGKAKKGKKSRPDDLQREIEQIQKRTAALQAETAAMAGLNPLVDDYGYALEKARAEQELLQAAQDAGKTITPELRQQISELAGAYAQASASAEKLAETQEQVREANDFLKGAMADAFMDLVPAIETGNAALDKFLNTLIEAVFQAMLLGKGPLAGLFGGGGGFLAGIGKMFGFDEGGYTGPGGKKQPAGVVHKGEIVWSQADIRRAGGVGRVEAMRKGMAGYANGGVVGSVPIRMPTIPTITPTAKAEQRIIIVSRFDADGGFESAVSRTAKPIADKSAGLAAAAVGKRVPAIAAEQQQSGWRRLRPQGGL